MLHATSTPLGDYVELDAINRLELENVPLVANKSQIDILWSLADLLLLN